VLLRNRRSWPATLAAVVFSGCLCLAPYSYAAAQDPAGPKDAPPGAPILPPGTIDGSVTPELIPDSTASWLFFTAASVKPNRSVNEQARQRALLAGAGLSHEDMIQVATILAEFRDQMTSLEQSYDTAMQAAQASHSVAELDFTSQRDAVVSATRTVLAAKLSPGALKRLDRLIQSEKRRMKIVPFPGM
jgi:hypothetical protein